MCFSKMLKTSGHMAQGKSKLKFERNPCNNNRDKWCHRWTTDGRGTTDEFRFHELCWHSQAELKMFFFFLRTLALVLPQRFHCMEILCYPPGLLWEAQPVQCNHRCPAKTDVMLEGNLGFFDLPATGQAPQLPAQLRALSQPYKNKQTNKHNTEGDSTAEP